MNEGYVRRCLEWRVSVDCGTDLVMVSLIDSVVSSMPASLIDGVFELAASRLGVANVRHRSALLHLKPFNGVSFVNATCEAVRRNYQQSGAAAKKDQSSENWRWHRPQPQIGERNRSPEVVVERAVAAACVTLGRTDWSNQIPVASGLVADGRDGRRAIDLVRRVGDHHFHLIELKVASDTPLYAAVEVLGYAFLWLIGRNDRPLRPSALLEASQLNLRVLAPAEFYAPFQLQDVEASIDAGVRSLGEQYGVSLSFRFDVLNKRIRSDAMPTAVELLELLDQPLPLHTA